MKRLEATFVAEVPPGTRLAVVNGRVIVVHPDFPPAELTLEGFVPLVFTPDVQDKEVPEDSRGQQWTRMI